MIKSSLQSETLKALQPLIGLSMWTGGRTANLIWLHFGHKRTVLTRTGEKEVGEFALHLQCFWQICDRETILVASGDRFYPRGNPFDEAEDFDWIEPGVNRCDEKLEDLFQGRRSTYFSVRSVHPDKYGGFLLRFRASIRLYVSADNTVNDEKWRLFRPYAEGAHFVVGGPVS